MMHFALQKKLHTAEGEMQLNIDCAVNNGELVSLYGSSGAGKTSVLRMLAGFMKPEHGCIEMNKDVWFDNNRHINIKPQQRKIGFVFQDYALFPNMNVQQNIEFAVPKNESKNIVAELLDLTGLSTLSARKIDTLSGGQKQRVALARAIASKPLLLLLDEPLSAIDNNMRRQLQETLLQVHKRFNLTTILVSHDMDEIIKLADKIIHLENGFVQQFTTPAAFFTGDQNATALIANVIGVEHAENETYTLLLLNNRIIRVNSTEHDVNFKTGDKCELIYKSAVPLIRKL